MNIFEQALFERFHRLGLGAPDDRISEIMSVAATEVSTVVKGLLNKQYDLYLARKKEISKELTKKRNKTYSIPRS